MCDKRCDTCKYGTEVFMYFRDERDKLCGFDYIKVYGCDYGSNHQFVIIDGNAKFEVMRGSCDEWDEVNGKE